MTLSDSCFTEINQLFCEYSLTLARAFYLTGDLSRSAILFKQAFYSNGRLDATGLVDGLLSFNETLNLFLSERIDRSPLSFDHENIPQHFFSVPIESCTTVYGFDYSELGYHPFINLIYEYEKNPGLTYEGSSLENFYNFFTPDNANKTVFLNRSYNDKVNPYFWPMVLKTRLLNPDFLYGLNGSYVNYLPKKLDEAKNELSRVLATYKSIKNNSFLLPDKFNPTKLKDDLIGVKLIVTPNQISYCVTQGEHRMAALAALGYERVPVFLDLRSGKAFFDVNNTENMPAVKNGLLSAEDLKTYLLALAEGSGREKAHYLGLKPIFY